MIGGFEVGMDISRIDFAYWDHSLTRREDTTTRSRGRTDGRPMLCHPTWSFEPGFLDALAKEC